MAPKSLRIPALLIVLLAGALVTAAAAAAPFSFSVTPGRAEVAPGGSVAYTISITAQPGFDDPISFTMDASSFGFSRSLDLGTSRGPYPQTISYTLEMPREVPPGVTVKATVTGTSGSDQVSQDLELAVKGQGGIAEALLGAINSIINSILSVLGMGK
jgi:hypothetical protein